jgi:polyisoprenoid-binding protein YceI
MKTIQKMAIFVLALTLSGSVFAGTQKVDASKSTVKWLAKKVTGEHYGTIAVKEGSLEADKGKISGGKIVIDMKSIKCDDIKDAGSNAKLVGHLNSDDFFSVEKNPTAELIINKVESKGDSHTFSGNLTIKGKTNPASFTATSAKDGKSTVYKGTMTVDRAKFDVRYGSNSFFENLGNKAIYDEFTLDFSLVVAE